MKDNTSKPKSQEKKVPDTFNLKKLIMPLICFFPLDLPAFGGYILFCLCKLNLLSLAFGFVRQTLGGIFA